MVEGLELFDKKDYLAALEKFREYSYADPGNPEPYRQMAYCLYCLDLPYEALLYIKRAIALEPNFAGSYTTLGAVYGMLREFRLEEEAYMKALELSPYIPSARYNLSYCLFRKGLFIAGAHNYRAGLEMGHQKIRVPYNHWDVLNEEFPEQIFIYQDQGFGDAIQFAGYMGAICDRCTHVYLEVDYRLYPLFAYMTHEYDNLTILSKQMDGSLPFNPLEIKTASMFSVMLYMMEHKADFDYPWFSHIKTPKLPDDYDNKVGVCWKGSPAFKNDRNRSMKAEEMKEIVGDRPAVSLIPNEAPFDEWITPGPIDSFLTTFFILDKLSEVHTVDTAVAHLAGAMNIPTNLYLPYVQDWRWGFNPYKSIEIFQQRSPKEWKTVQKGLI